MLIYELTMPKLGLTMEKGTIVRWIKGPGAAFLEGEVILEVETDKSVVEVEAPRSGYLRVIRAAEGVTVDVGAIIAYYSDKAEEALPANLITPACELDSSGEPKTPVAALKDFDAPVTAAAGGEAHTGRVKASPRARKLAAGKAVDLRSIKGSGPGGRIVSADVIRAADAAQAFSLTAAPAAESFPAAPALVAPGGETAIIIADSKRRIIAQRMLESTQNIPQYFVTMEADMKRSMHVLSLMKEDILRRFGVKPTLTDLLVITAARALTEFKIVNAYFLHSGSDMRIQYNERVNIGIAVDVEGSLLVPVIKSAHSLSLGEIAVERNTLVEKARRGRLKPADMQDGTFTISNMGSIGVHSFRAIINPPESAILAAGAIIKKPVVVEEDAIAVRPMMALTLTADHRIVDGAVAGRFLSRLVILLQQMELDLKFK